MEFSFKPKVAGAGSFTPPPGYQLIDGEWVNTADVFEESITTTCSIKENDMDEQQSTPECSDTAEAATAEATTTETACSATAEVNVEAAGCSETATTETAAAETTETAAAETTETATAESVETTEESTE